MIKQRDRIGERTKKLLVINFVMDADHTILGFCSRWVEELVDRSDEIMVVTGGIGSVPNSLRANVVSSGWTDGQNVRNVFRFYRILIKTLASFRPTCVFTHMAAAQGLLATPLSRLFRVRHVLWYAHPSVPLWLRIGRPLFSEVVTSVPSSFPSRRRPAIALGQGIETSLFGTVRASFETPAKFVTWGRCDPVKNLDHIADCVHEFNELRGTHTRIVVVGSPSGKEARDWWASVIERDNNRARPVIIWKPGVPQTEMGSLVDHASAFLHASSTGFDKAALEAASLGIPVLSTSDPIRTALGGLPSRSDLVAQLTYWADLPALERAKFAGAQQALVNDSHSLSHLADSLSEVLYPWKSK